MVEQEGDVAKFGRNHLTFCLLGFVLLTETSIKLSAAQDILSETFIPSTMFLMVNYGPHVVVALILPYFQHRVPIWLRWGVICLCFSGGLMTIALAEDVHVRLAALCVTSVGHGTAEVTFAALSAFYEETAIYWFSTGTGVGFLIGPLFYSGMTTLACFSMKTTLLVASALPLLYIASYFLLDKERLPHTYFNATSRNDVQYSALNSEPQDPWLSVREKLHVVWKTLPLTIVLFQCYVLGYLTMQAVVTTIAFPSSSLDPRNHYVYYMLCFTIGEFVSRSYASIGRLLRPERDFLVRKYWIFTLVLAVIQMFLLLSSWYRFLTNIWMVFLFTLMNGLTIGAAYANVLALAGENMDTARKEFSRGFVIVGLAFGLVCAGLIGTFVEPQLRLHCVYSSSIPYYCFTRPVHGWNATESCLL